MQKILWSWLTTQQRCAALNDSSTVLGGKLPGAPTLNTSIFVKSTRGTMKANSAARPPPIAAANVAHASNRLTKNWRRGMGLPSGSRNPLAFNRRIASSRGLNGCPFWGLSAPTTFISAIVASAFATTPTRRIGALRLRLQIVQLLYRSIPHLQILFARAHLFEQRFRLRRVQFCHPHHRRDPIPLNVLRQRAILPRHQLSNMVNVLLVKQTD